MTSDTLLNRLQARMPAPMNAAATLTAFAIIGSILVAASYQTTYQQIADNERNMLIRSLSEVVPPSLYDNELMSDTRTVTAPDLLGTSEPVTVYRARLQGEPVAAVLTPVAPDGYGGAIQLLVGIGHAGTLLGARVVVHQETPGLGDGIEARRSDWIQQFNGLSLRQPPMEKWAVKKDGGVFDQFSGATITPRAVVQAIKRSLLFFRQHREAIFAEKERR